MWDSSAIGRRVFPGYGPSRAPCCGADSTVLIYLAESMGQQQERSDCWARPTRLICRDLKNSVGQQRGERGKTEGKILNVTWLKFTKIDSILLEITSGPVAMG